MSSIEERITKLEAKMDRIYKLLEIGKGGLCCACEGEEECG